MRKLVSLLLAICMMAVMVPALADGVSGTFSGEAKGYGGMVTVTITLTDGVITAVETVADDETDGFGKKAAAELPATTVEPKALMEDWMATLDMENIMP